MKILILGNQARSTSNFWTVLMRRMRAAGHEVLCAVPAGDDAAEAAIRAIGEEDPAFRKGPAVRLCHYPLDRKGLNPLRDMATMHALYRLFRQEKPDLLFASTIKPVIYGCMAARLARVPHIYATITGLGYAFEADNFFKKCVNRLSIGLYHCALAGAEGVFFQNRDDAELFRKVGILRRSARVLMARGTGVDIRRFAEAPLPPLPAEGCAPEEREIIFLLVGRLLEAKGLPEYAAAAKELKTQYPAARFQLLGPPEQGLGSVDLAQVRRWQDEGSIEYLGETRDVRPYVEACHALVLPSWREGTPTSIMEGMSMGRAAVVTDVPGCREVVEDGVNGCICAAHDRGRWPPPCAACWTNPDCWSAWGPPAGIWPAANSMPKSWPRRSWSTCACPARPDKQATMRARGGPLLSRPRRDDGVSRSQGQPVRRRRPTGLSRPLYEKMEKL